MKTPILDRLHDIRGLLESILRDISASASVQISPSHVGPRIEELCRAWSDELEGPLRHQFGLGAAALSSYTNGFRDLFRLSRGRNRRTTYQHVIKGLLQNFRAALEEPVLFAVPSGGMAAQVEAILSGSPYPDQKDYLDEAIRCLRAGCRRAAGVLGWSAAVHQIHTKIEEIGFAVFNAEAAKLKRGRFKHLSLPVIESVSHLREANDRHILMVLDGLDLIDSNQRARLDHCVDIRIHCSHPGDAPITDANLLSFFSDLSEIVFKNPKLII
jgi:hypothetical protein